VPFPPPIPFVLALLFGVLLERWWPLVALPGGMAREGLGVALAAFGLAIVWTGILTFRRARTAVYPNRPAKVLVDHGVYRFTRNPMYLGMTLFTIGGALIFASAWALLLLPVALWIITTQVIRREEAHLRARFPEAYADYCARVGRWWTVRFTG
jgi:protein-S-isoprenylcysteine O-methyltransferase Ste14